MRNEDVLDAVGNSGNEQFSTRLKHFHDSLPSSQASRKLSVTDELTTGSRKPLKIFVV